MPDYTFVAGPSGTVETAIRVAAHKIITLIEDITLTGTSIFIWTTATVKLKIGDTEIPLTSHDTSDSGWTLSYADSVEISGDLTVETSVQTDIGLDVRGFNADVSADARDYYYHDVIDNSGNIVLP